MRDYNHDGKIDKYDHYIEELQMKEWDDFCEENKKNPPTPMEDAIAIGIVIGILLGIILFVKWIF